MKKNNMDDKSRSIISRNGVHILVTEEDKTGENILAMSDFFGGYIQQLTDVIRTNVVTTLMSQIFLPLTLKSLAK